MVARWVLVAPHLCAGAHAGEGAAPRSTGFGAEMRSAEMLAAAGVVFEFYRRAGCNKRE